MHLDNFYKIILLMGFLSLLVFSCLSEDTSIPLTENSTFNELLQEVPAIKFDLDGIAVDTVIVTPQQRLGTESSSFFPEPVTLGFPTSSFIKPGDTLYVASRHRIYAMDKEGAWQYSVGREGKGPGEFASTLKFADNAEHIFAFDYGNGRIQVYDHRLNLISVINKMLYDLHFRRNFALTDTRLYLGLRPYSNDHMIAVYRTDNLENEMETFWPKIIPNHLQPRPYNHVILDVNSHENIAITNLGLPYLFLLNSDREMKHVLFFESTYYQKLENPSAKPVSAEGNTEETVPGVGTFIKLIRITDDDVIYFTVGNNLYQIISDNNRYRLCKAWHFINNDREKLDITEIIIEEETLYFVTLFGRIFRVPLN